MVYDIIDLLPTEPENQLDIRKEDQIRLYVVHWDGGPVIPEGYEPVDYYVREAQFHIDKDWGDGAHSYGIAYHEKIDRWGRVYLVRPATHIVWAATGANDWAYNICLDATVGQDPTPAQMEALATRMENLRQARMFSRGVAWGHGELRTFGNNTSCPGEKLLAWLKDYRSQADYLA